MKKIEWDPVFVEKIRKNIDVKDFPLFKRSHKDKYYKVVWFGKIELAEKYARKVQHTQKIMVIEDVEYRNNNFNELISFQKLWFGIKVKYINDYKVAVFNSVRKK